jgi:hypothetical protein
MVRHPLNPPFLWACDFAVPVCSDIMPTDDSSLEKSSTWFPVVHTVAMALVTALTSAGDIEVPTISAGMLVSSVADTHRDYDFLLVVYDGIIALQRIDSGGSGPSVSVNIPEEDS